MKRILFLALVLFLAYVGYRYMCPWSFTNPGYASAAPVVPTAVSQRTVICPDCNKDGFYMRIGSRPDQNRKENCPLCLGWGYKLLPADAKVCADCCGMGRVEDHGKKGDIPISVGPKIASMCRRCEGKGYIVHRQQGPPPLPFGGKPIGK